MECLIIEPDFQRQSDEPVCDVCAKAHCQRLAERLGREEMEKAKSYPPPPPNETEVLKQRNVILEQHARLMEQQQKEQEVKQKEQEAKMAKMEANMEKMAGLLSQLMKA